MIDKLEFLIALSRERHFGRAAELCGVTQPTLSAGLKQLEGELGVLLVARGSRFQGFTADGERVLDWARRIVGDARAMRQEIDALKRGLSGHLRLSVIPTALSMVASLTTPYRARHPNVTFTILSRTSAEVLKDPVYRIAAAPAATSRIPKTTPVKNLTGPPCGSPLYAWSGAVRHSRSGPDST